jgi:stringent starvation protein B
MHRDTTATTSTKPYLVRAIYDWILDNGMTPHLVIDVRWPGVVAPREFVEDHRLVLNIAPSAVRGLALGNEQIAFNARFGGVARDVSFPVDAVVGIFTRENGQGMVFPELAYPGGGDEPGSARLSVVEQDQAPPDSPDAGPSGAAGTAGKRKGRGGPTLKVVK